VNENGYSATYSPEDNKLRLYVGRVPRDEYEKLRAEGWTSTPKQNCNFVATICDTLIMNDMINDWKPETRSLLKALVAAGFELVSGDNGEDVFTFEGCDLGVGGQRGQMNNFIENLIACDEARLYVKCPKTGKVRWIYLVLGNSPGEIASDYSIPAEIFHSEADPLDTVTDEHYNRWEGRKQPKIRAADKYPQSA